MSRHPNSQSTRVLQALATRPAASTAELSAATGIDIPQVTRALKYGRLTGVVDSEQQGGTWRHWLCGTIRLPTLARDRVLACIRSGTSTRADVATRLGMRPSTVQRATMTLESEGLIVIHADPHPAPHRMIATPTQQVAK